MADQEFPCRTKEVKGISYRVKIFDAKGDLRLSTTYRNEKERADRFVKNMTEGFPGSYGEITEVHWTETVCIECGQESW